ncbi:hypothetical protein [Flavobacterium sp. HSC-61S13]|uniref:hypothetical protein n=1 Tax=Flavobacterium sp. HSC-61S13 TaxID=2910963 RepID=UPI0020A1FC72|nr:hypothetical protein [Flavobacterium sp. HSC-61S13]MCP1997296.1 hypothetical protein [Flavobacterium sp. HSC-61S13]
MKTDLPQPFKIQDIQNYPKAVFIAFLIGLILVFGSLLGTVFYRREDTVKECESEKKELYRLILKERSERIDLYESMLFYKQKSNALENENQNLDSLYRGRTEQFVKKLLK